MFWNYDIGCLVENLFICVGFLLVLIGFVISVNEWGMYLFFFLVIMVVVISVWMVGW